jgi:hypothetical protein
MPPKNNSQKIAEVSFVDQGVASQENTLKVQPLWNERNKDEENFLKLKMARIEALWQYASGPHEQIRENIRLIEGKATVTNDSGINNVIEVMPIARAFVEAKTAEEIKVTSAYKFTPKKDARNNVFANIINDLADHVKKVTSYKSHKHTLTRQKNIMGVSIKRKGYRLIEQWDKIPTEFDRNGIPTCWEIKKIPFYDDIFEDIISPLQFAVDPNCTTLNDAEDCVCYTFMSKNKFDITFGNDPRWINTDKVNPGVKFKFNTKGDFIAEKSIQDKGVVVEEYFNVILNEWVVVANGVLISPIFTTLSPVSTDEKGNAIKDVYGFPLPDRHRQLPFVAQFNHSSFITESFGSIFTSSSSASEFSSYSSQITGKETFWRKGDPHVLKDLITLETGLTQAMFRNAKLASQVIIATDRGYKFKSKKWKSGDQAIGMKGRYEVSPLGQTQQGQIQPLLDFLFQMKVLAIGIDPRNISQDNKTKSATEAAIIQETSMRRLNENIQFNIQEGELRDGNLTLKLIVQYYSVPEMVRLNGDESIEDLKLYHDVQYVERKEKSKDGAEDKLIQIPVIGKKYRSIQSKMTLEEKQESDTGKYLLTKSEEGAHSFLLRPEYINILDVDIEITSENKLGEIQAVTKQQTNELVNTFLTLFAATNPGPNGEAPAIDKSDLPPMKDIIKRLMVVYDLSTEWSDQKNMPSTKTSQQESSMQEYMQNRKPLSPTATASANQSQQDMSQLMGGPQTLSSSPNVNGNISAAA